MLVAVVRRARDRGGGVRVQVPEYRQLHHAMCCLEGLDGITVRQAFKGEPVDTHDTVVPLQPSISVRRGGRGNIKG